MSTDEMIEAIKAEIVQELSVITDNDVYASYRARNVQAWTQALKNLTDIKYREEK